MQPRALVAIIGFILGISSGVAQDSAATERYAVEDAYQVYGALLLHEESAGFAKGTLVIREETVSPPEAPETCLTPEAASKFKDAIAGYKMVNRKQWRLQRQFHIEKPYELVNSDNFGTLFKQGDWDGFYKRYPGSGGYIILSAVGFNHDNNQALVYTGSACGNLCGRWGFHLLEKIGGTWREAPGVSCTMVS